MHKAPYMPSGVAGGATDVYGPSDKQNNDQVAKVIIRSFFQIN